MWTIRPLRKSHRRKEFDCGNDILNRYLQTQASQDVRDGEANCYVLSVDDADEIIDFFTLSNWLIHRTELPSIRSAYSAVPMTFLGRLAVDLKYQSQGLGRFLLASAAELAANSTSGSRGLIVQAKDEKLLDFYKRNGFMLLKQELCAALFFDKKRS